MVTQFRGKVTERYGLQLDKRRAEQVNRMCGEYGATKAAVVRALVEEALDARYGDAQA